MYRLWLRYDNIEMNMCMWSCSCCNLYGITCPYQEWSWSINCYWFEVNSSYCVCSEVDPLSELLSDLSSQKSYGYSDLISEMRTTTVIVRCSIKPGIQGDLRSKSYRLETGIIEMSNVSVCWIYYYLINISPIYGNQSLDYRIEKWVHSSKEYPLLNKYHYGRSWFDAY